MHMLFFFFGVVYFKRKDGFLYHQDGVQISRGFAVPTESTQPNEQETRNLYARSSPAPPLCSGRFHAGHTPARRVTAMLWSPEQRLEERRGRQKRSERKLEEERARDEVKRFADKIEREKMFKRLTRQPVRIFAVWLCSSPGHLEKSRTEVTFP